jgi:hypothetical protein
MPTIATAIATTTIANGHWTAAIAWSPLAKALKGQMRISMNGSAGATGAVRNTLEVCRSGDATPDKWARLIAVPEIPDGVCTGADKFD